MVTAINTEFQYSYCCEMGSLSSILTIMVSYILVLGEGRVRSMELMISE